MKKTFDLDELDCACCGAKIEDAISKLDGVTYVSVSYMTQKLTLEADDAVFNQVLDEAGRICTRIEPDCHIVR